MGLIARYVNNWRTKFKKLFIKVSKEEFSLRCGGIFFCRDA